MKLGEFSEKTGEICSTPKRLKKDEQVSDSFSTANFICEPLEPGYGITLGNALRRVLLSSIQGPAITAVVIDGVSHEFSTMPGVMEDVTEIILNLKNVDLKMHTYDPQTVTLNVEGPGEIKASDITTTHMVEVVNGEQHIATLGDEAKLDMELTVKMGSGYEPVSRRETHKSIGLIHVDAFFSPVKKVNYTVTNARVGTENRLSETDSRDMDKRHDSSRRGACLQCKDYQAAAKRLH